jgi:hypothetical protein
LSGDLAADSDGAYQCLQASSTTASTGLSPWIHFNVTDLTTDAPNPVGERTVNYYPSTHAFSTAADQHNHEILFFALQQVLMHG